MRSAPLLLLAVLALLPSAWRAVRPDPRPLVLNASVATSEADRLFYGERMDLNRVDAEGLELIPGIGPALAERIVSDREARGPFDSIEDVERVRGIGPAKRALISEWATVVR